MHKKLLAIMCLLLGVFTAFTSAGAAPLAPEGISSAVTNSSATLTWTAGAGDAVLYNVYRDGVKIGETAEASYKDIGLNRNTPYDYTVKSADEAGEESGPVNISATTSDVGSVPTAAAVYYGHLLSLVNVEGTKAEVLSGATKEYAIVKYKGRDSIASSTGVKLYFAADDAFIKNDNSIVSFAITYFDNGNNPINVEYNAAGGTSADDYKTVQIARTNTNKWKKKIITVQDASFRNAQFHGSDFRINNQSPPATPIYISKAEVMPGYYEQQSAVLDIHDPRNSEYMSYFENGSGDSAVEVVTYEGLTAVKIVHADGVKQKMYVGVDDDYAAGTYSKVTARVTFFDGEIVSGLSNRVAIEYKNASDLATFAFINKTGTNKWVTRDVVLPDILLNNSFATGTDLRINTSGNSVNEPVYISKLEIILTATPVPSQPPVPNEPGEPGNPPACTQDEASTACITFGANGKANKMSVVVSDVPSADNYAAVLSYMGRDSLSIRSSRGQIPVKVDKSLITPADRNIAVKIKYFDKGIDMIVFQHTSVVRGDKRNVLIQKENTNTWRTATILLDDNIFNGDRMYGSDFQIGSLESHPVQGIEYIAGIEVINLDKLENIVQNGMKGHTLHETEAAVLHYLGLLEAVNADQGDYGLEMAVTREQAVQMAVQLTAGGTDALHQAGSSYPDVSEEARPYIGYAVANGIVSDKGDGTFGGSEPVSLRQVLDIFIRAYGSKDGYDSVAAKAIELGLLQRIASVAYFGEPAYRTANTGFYENEISTLDRYAFRDDLAGIAFSALQAVKQDNQQNTLLDLINNGVIDQERLVDSGSKTLLYLYYDLHGIQLEEKSYIDPKTGVKVNSIGLPGTNTANMYFSAMSSVDGKNILLTTAVDFQGKKGFLAVYNIETKETAILDDRYAADYYNGVVAPGNVAFYYIKDEVYAYNINTKEKRLLARHPDGKAFYGVPSVTNDGELLALYWRSDDADKLPRSIAVINTVTGEFNEVLTAEQVKAKFSLPDNSIDHPIMNPEYKNLIFYARNSAAQIADRIYLLNTETGDNDNLYKQKFTPEGSLGEHVGHEMWSYNGERLYFIKYTSSAIAPSGAMYVDKTGQESRFINGDFPYLHLGVSRDEKWIAADTAGQLAGNQYTSSVVLIDVEGNRSIELANIPMWSVHPGHPHPIISLDGSKVIFAMADENDYLRVGYIDIQDYTAAHEQPAAGGATLTADYAQRAAGEQTVLTVGVSQVSRAFTAAEAIVQFDPEVLEFALEAHEAEDGTVMVLADEAIASMAPGYSIESAVRLGDGRIKVMMFATGAPLTGTAPLFKLIGRVKEGASANQTTTVALSDLMLAFEGDGQSPDTAEATAAIQIIERPVVPPDTVELSAQIAQAQALLANAAAGAKIGQHAAADMEMLAQAIADAAAIRDSASSSQADVDAAGDMLENAMELFAASLITLAPDATKVSILDLSILAKYYGIDEQNGDWSKVAAADMDDNGRIDIADLAVIARMILDGWALQP